MKKKLFILFIVMILCGVCFGVITGSGTAIDPYLIGSTADWTTFTGDSATYWASGVYTKLNANLDFGGGSIAPCDAASGLYAGNFNGNDKVIANGNIVPVVDSLNHNGLFEKLDASAEVYDLVIANVTITGDCSTASVQSYAGILFGESTFGSSIHGVRIKNSTVTHTHVNATKPSYVGMIAGANHGDMADCSVSRGSVNADMTTGETLHIGGVAGVQTGGGGLNVGTMSNCSSTAYIYNIGALSAGDITSIGGVVGSIFLSGTIDVCYHEGIINYTTNNGRIRAGGIVGQFSNGFTRSYHNGTIILNSGTAYTYAGGLGAINDNVFVVDSCYAVVDMDITAGAGSYVGGAFARASTSTPTITNCYVNGAIFNAGDIDISGLNVFGGFIGYGLNATISNCYAVVGPWDGADTNREGFIGLNSGCTLSGCIWDQAVAAFADTTGDDGTSSTTAEMTTSTPFSGYPADKWKQADGKYPILKWATYPLSEDEGQFGTTTGPFGRGRF